MPATAYARAEQLWKAPEPRDPNQLEVSEHLNELLPGGLSFVASTGERVQLRDLVTGRGRPTVLTLVYYSCPNLCGLMLTGLVDGLKKTGLVLGRDYDVVTLSFNPRETATLAAERQGRFLSLIGRPEARDSWHFLVGEEKPIRAVADAVGYPYRWDEGSAQYAHLAAVVVLTPEGRVSRYLYGVEFPPRDLRLSIVEASQGRVGTAFDRVLLTCFHYDPASRRYGFFINIFIRIGGLIVFAALTTLLWVLWRRERVLAVTAAHPERRPRTAGPESKGHPERRRRPSTSSGLSPESKGPSLTLISTPNAAGPAEPPA